jgi:hypothetical protein
VILATPFIPTATDYEHLAKELRRRGKLLTHVHLVLSRLEDEDAAYAFGEGLSDIFLKSHTIVLPEDTRNGNQLSVDLFRAATRFAHEYVAGTGELANPAMLYMDPSYRPLENAWLEKIQAEYYFHNAPMVLGRFTREEPRLLAGPAVIRKDFYARSTLLKFVPPNIHYRNYLQHEFLQNAVETTLIGPGSQDSVLRPYKTPAPRK